MKEKISEATSFGRPGIRVRVSPIGGTISCEEEEEEDGGVWVIALLWFSFGFTKWESMLSFLNRLQTPLS